MDDPMLAERLLEASRTDAGLLAELRRAWRGTLDVQDALWWHTHPLSSTPDGRPDPASALASLKATVYSRAAAAEPVIETVDPVTGETIRSTASERELHAAIRRQAENADAMADLLEQFRSGRAPGLASPAESPIDPRDPAGTEEADFRRRSGRPRRTVPPRRARDILLLATGVVVGIIGILGVQALGHRPLPSDAALVASASPTPSPTPSREAVDAVIRDVQNDVGIDPDSEWIIVPADSANPDPFWIFNEPSNLPAGGVPDLGPDIFPSSIRTVASTERYVVYVAQNHSEEYCIIVSDVPQTGWASGCNDAADIRRSGLWVGMPVPADAASENTSIDVSWGTDGSFTIGPSSSAGR